jgi:menaquinone-dependent protoporphyrinogen IX oxidase
MKAVVVYTSKSGFVKRYAEMIGRALSADVLEASGVTADTLAKYDTVIYGGGLYVGGINGLKLITGNMEKLSGKKLIVFASGATPVREETIEELRDRNFTKEQQQAIRFFYLRGGFDYAKLKPVDKILMTLMKWKIRSRKDKSADERGMLAAYSQPADFVKEKNMEALVAYAKGE